MKYIVENKNSNYIDEIKYIINTRKKEIYDFFNVPDQELNCNIYIYKNIESLINGLEKRGFGKFPSYICACQRDEDNSINYFEPKDNPGPKEWSKEEYKMVIFHELIHAIEFNIYGNHPEWLSEGIAKYLDGTYSKGIKHLLENFVNKIKIPNQKEIEEEFGMHEDYNSYDYAYLMVSYLIEIYGKKSFISGLKNINEFNKMYTDDLITKAINYFNSKYCL